MAFIPSILHAHDNIQVHPYIAEQAFYVWPNDTDHEIYQYLGIGFDTTVGGCPEVVTGNNIREGLKEEDDYIKKDEFGALYWKQ